MIAVDTNIYFSKSTTPGIQWKTPHTTKEKAETQAAKFVRDWADVGVKATARMFYRDGSFVKDFGVEQ